MAAEGRGSGEQLRLLDDEVLPAPVAPAPPPQPLAWPARLRAALVEQPESAVPPAEEALRAFPGDGELLLLAVLAALVAEHPDRALSYLKRFYKRYQPTRATTLLTAIASAQQGRARQAWELLEPKGLLLRWQARLCFVGGRAMEPWLNEQLARIEREHARLKRGPRGRRARRRRAPRPSPPPAPEAAPLPHLPALATTFDVQFELGNAAALLVDDAGDGAGAAWYRLRAELGQLGLLQGFDELLCLSGQYWRLGRTSR